MAVHTPLKVDHQVLGEDFCSGYMDPFGNWNTGFPCPRLDEETPGLCCGVDNLKYCCNGHGPRHIVNDVTHLPLVMGVVFGMSVAMIVSVVVCCFKCSCCLLYKKRQPANTGPLYHLHCSSSGSAGGVANMYSFSSDATPQDTPRSSTRSHRTGANNRWSTATADSGPGLLSLDHHLALLEDANPATVHASFRPGPHNLSEDRLSNNGSGGRLPSSIGLGRALTGNTVGSLTEDEELPPPYNSNHSTLIAVRTNHAHQGQYTQPATSNEANNTTNSTNRISNITTATNNHPGSLSRTPPPPSLPSSSSSSSNIPQGFPTFLHQQHQQQHSLSSSGAPSPRPHFTQSRPQQRHSIASVASEDSFGLGFPAFPPPPSEVTASPASCASNIFSLPAPPPPSLTLPQSLSLHHNHQQQHNNNNNWHHQRSSSLYNPCSTSSHCSNSSSGTFAPVLSPTRRPCSTAHIVHMHNQNPPIEQQHMYTATKF